MFEIEVAAEEEVGVEAAEGEVMVEVGQATVTVLMIYGLGIRIRMSLILLPMYHLLVAFLDR